jgi:hypothetical protein
VTRHRCSRCLLSSPTIEEAASIRASRLICRALDHLVSDCKAQRQAALDAPEQPAFSIVSQFFEGTSPFTPALAGVVDGVRVLAPPITSSTRRRVGRLAVHFTTAAAHAKLGVRYCSWSACTAHTRPTPRSRSAGSRSHESRGPKRAGNPETRQPPHPRFHRCECSSRPPPT